MAEFPPVAPHGRLFRLVWLPLARAFVWGLMTLLGPFRRIGAYRVPRAGGLLILSNHLADVDPIAVQLACPRPIHFMGKSELFEMKVVGPIMRAYRAFPVNRGQPDRAALKHAIELLKAGEVVCVFPEGQLSETGELQELKPGIALLARSSGAAVLCLGLQGTNRILPYGSLVPRPAFRLVTATWGEPRIWGKDSTSEEILAWAEGDLRSLIS